MLTINFEKFGMQDGDRILDLGCGVGRHVISSYTLKNIQAVGLDLCHADLVTAKERFTTEFEEPQNEQKSFGLTVGDALNLPFPDNSFDRVICSEVLEHIPDYKSVLKEIRRVMKPGGVFAASVPRFFPEWVCWKLSEDYHNEKGGHIRIFKADEFRNAIEDEGMTWFGGHGAHALHVPYWWLQCLFWAKRESSKTIKAYHKLLVWDLLKKPWITQVIDKILNPVMGKSIVMYFK